jgi:hypothetical protein
MVGAWAYDRFVEHVEAVGLARRTGTFLPHPALRTR